MTTGASAIFSSYRERRLWTWTAIAVVGIYATLALAQQLAGELRDRGLLDRAFFVGMLLIGAAIVTQSVRLRPSGIEIGIGLGIAAIYLMLMLRMAVPEERSHLIEYSVVALLIHEALLERRSQGRNVLVPALAAIAATTAIGALDESIQLLIPSRVFDWFDVLFNFLAAVLAVGASVSLRWARRRRASRNESV